MKGDIITYSTEIKKIVKEYYEQLYVSCVWGPKDLPQVQ